MFVSFSIELRTRARVCVSVPVDVSHRRTCICAGYNVTKQFNGRNEKRVAKRYNGLTFTHKRQIILARALTMYNNLYMYNLIFVCSFRIPLHRPVRSNVNAMQR